MTDPAKTYILVILYYNEYDDINHQEFWNFDSLEEAKAKEQELIESTKQKIETLIHAI